MKLLEDKIIKFKDGEHACKMTMRAMIRYEQISGHSIDITNGFEDICKLFYCTFIAGGANLEYEKFLDLIDDDVEAVASFTKWALSGNPEKKAKAR